MSKTMETTEKKLQLDTLDTTDNNQSSEIIKFEVVENSPFTIAEQNEVYFGILGTHRITEDYTDKNKLKYDLTEITWDRIIQVIWAVAEKYKDIEQLTKSTNEQ